MTKQQRQERTYADLQARLARIRTRGKPSTARRGVAGRPTRTRAKPTAGNACHQPGCKERFLLLSDWERHAAKTGHDARRYGRSSAPPATSTRGISYADHQPPGAIYATEVQNPPAP